jgi:hypothetical protein
MFTSTGNFVFVERAKNAQLISNLDICTWRDTIGTQATYHSRSCPDRQMLRTLVMGGGNALDRNN